jgi:hypothetical protein
MRNAPSGKQTPSSRSSWRNADVERYGTQQPGRQDTWPPEQSDLNAMNEMAGYGVKMGLPGDNRPQTSRNQNGRISEGAVLIKRFGQQSDPNALLRWDTSTATAEEYRQLAVECLRWAAETEDMREAFLQMARDWTAAALRAEGLLKPEVPELHHRPPSPTRPISGATSSKANTPWHPMSDSGLTRKSAQINGTSTLAHHNRHASDISPCLRCAN